ncbi:MAG: hypothetical protein H6963_12680 [Chromatiaceae bacterium]|nr:hypothetical protein [Chromatiaceae bacterium]
MKEIFLSASVPEKNRGHYYESANPFLIQCAVRELLIAVIRDYRIVWGGHPAITPMIWTICQDLGINYTSSVILYQSRYFEKYFPEENQHFDNVIVVDAIENQREASLLQMRRAMLSREELCAAVFIGGMEGVKEEYGLFKELHPEALVFPVPSPGGAALDLAIAIGTKDESHLKDVDFVRLYHQTLVPFLETVAISTKPIPT